MLLFGDLLYSFNVFLNVFLNNIRFFGQGCKPNIKLSQFICISGCFCIRFLQCFAAFGFGIAQLGKPAFGCFSAFGKLFDLPFAPQEAEFAFLEASAGHASAGVKNVAFQRCNAKCRFRTSADKNSGVNIANNDRSAEKVFKNAAVFGRKAHKLGGNAETAVNAAKTVFFLIGKQARTHCADGEKRGAAVVMVAEIVNKIFRIVFGGNNNVLKSRTECGFNSTFVFLRNG